MAAQGPQDGTGAVLAVFNAGPATAFALPGTAVWQMILDTTRPEAAPEPAHAGLIVPAHCVIVFADKGDST